MVLDGRRLFACPGEGPEETDEQNRDGYDSPDHEGGAGPDETQSQTGQDRSDCLTETGRTDPDRDHGTPVLVWSTFHVDVLEHRYEEALRRPVQKRGADCDP